MTDKIKLIWDFRGPDAKQIAEHYKIHLDQYAQTNNLSDYQTGIEPISSMYTIAYFEVLLQDKENVVNALKPHRSEE